MNPQYSLQTLLLACLVRSALAVDCKAAELEAYQFDLLKGLYAQSIVLETPPSKSTFKWYVGVCGDLVAPQCPRGSLICGVEEVSTPGSKTIVTKVIAIPNTVKPVYTETTANTTHPESVNGIALSYKEVAWGTRSYDVEIQFECDSDLNKAGLEIAGHTDASVTLRWKTSAACLKKRDEKPKPPKEGGSSWGWFTWLFILVVLGAAGVIIFGAWAQVSTTGEINLNRMVSDFVDNSRGVTNVVPGFVGEVVERLVGRSDRGGYSAV